MTSISQLNHNCQLLKTSPHKGNQDITAFLDKMKQDQENIIYQLNVQNKIIQEYQIKMKEQQATIHSLQVDKGRESEAASSEQIAALQQKIKDLNTSLVQ